RTATENQAQQVAAYLYSGDPSGSTSEAQQQLTGSRVGFFSVCVARGNVALCGNSGLLERLDPDRVPSRGEKLQDALQAHADAPIRLMCVPTSEQQRVLREFLPSLPEEWGVNSQELTAIDWIVAGLEPQSAELAVTIQADSPEASAALHAALPNIVPAIA